MRAAAWESALGQALRLFGGARGAAVAAGDVAALVEGLAVQDLPRGGELRSSGGNMQRQDCPLLAEVLM